MRRHNNEKKLLLLPFQIKIQKKNKKKYGKRN
jgi:hypothetical protein